MNHIRKFLGVLLALAVATEDASAWQSPGGKDADRVNWEKVRTIGPEIEVDCRSSDRPSAPIRTYRGRLLRWEPDRLVLQLGKGGEKEIGKSLVQTVSTREKGPRRKGAAIGGAVGFGVGMGIGAASFGSLDKHGGTGQKIGFGVLMGLVWGGVGSLVGAAVSGTRVTTVYQTP